MTIVGFCGVGEERGIPGLWDEVDPPELGVDALGRQQTIALVSAAATTTTCLGGGLLLGGIVKKIQ